MYLKQSTLFSVIFLKLKHPPQPTILNLKNYAERENNVFLLALKILQNNGAVCEVCIIVPTTVIFSCPKKQLYIFNQMRKMLMRRPQV